MVFEFGNVQLKTHKTLTFEISNLELREIPIVFEHAQNGMFTIKGQKKLAGKESKTY